MVYSTFLGLNTHYVVELENGERIEIIQESLIDDIIENGTEIGLTVNSGKVNVFTKMVLHLWFPEGVRYG